VPIFDFVCSNCDNHFELLVRGRDTPSCPQCGSTQIEKQMSLPAIKSDGTHALALKAAKQRDSRLGSERVAAQREYEANHD
jgi:putative FmdB family regulatory protein